MRLPILAVLLLVAPAVAVEPAELEKAVRVAREFWNVPGVAVVIVKRGQAPVFFVQGTKRVGREEPVTLDTAFPLASCTKAFTSALVAKLVDEGRMNWDDPVRQYVPSFSLSDPAADKLVAIRDLFQHRTGLGGHDLLWYRAPWGPEEVVKRIGQLPLTHPFRTEFLYSSLPVTAAGLASAKAGRAKWDTLIREKICLPLEMKSVAFHAAEWAKLADRASGHCRTKSGVELMPESYPREPDAAGSMACSIRELAPWIALHLNGGKHGDRQLISTENLFETRQPATPIRRTPAVRASHPTATQVSYAMGWLVYDHRGKLVVAHGGILDGFRSLVLLAPDDGIGLAVLANLHETRLNMALGHTLFELLLDLPRGDWNAHYQKVVQAEMEEKAETKRRRDELRDPAEPPTVPAKELPGVYEHPAYGTSTLTMTGNKLVWKWSSFTMPVEPWRGDFFRISEGDFADDLLQFRIEDGKPRGLIHRGIEYRRK